MVISWCGWVEARLTNHHTATGRQTEPTESMARQTVVGPQDAAQGHRRADSIRPPVRVDESASPWVANRQLSGVRWVLEARHGVHVHGHR